MKNHHKSALQYYLLITLLFFSFGCREDDNVPVQEEEVVTPVPVEPVNIKLPEAIFTEPEKIEEGNPSRVIYDRLIKLVNAAPENASIYISIYAFQGFNDFIKALENAYSRNLKLHVMFDMGSHNEKLVSKNFATAKVIKALGEGVELIFIDNDAGKIAINHNKFILFSAVETENGTIENVIFQTSHNFTESDTYRIQDAVTLTNKGLYQAYFDYWQDMAELAAEGMNNFEYREFNDPAAGITAFFYPKRKDGAFIGGDTIIEILDDITDPASTTIKIGMSGWTNSRVSIVEKLEELQKIGAKIEIVTKGSIGPDVYDGLKVLHQNGAYVKIFNMKDRDQQRINIHAKFMIIEGEWRGEQTNLVLTGSQNFSINALKNNNETSLLFQDHQFFPTYKSYYEELKTLPGICCP